MSQFIGKMTELKREHHAALVIVHHSNKNLLAVDAMDRARGSTKLTGWVDTVIGMFKQPSGIVQLQFGKTRNSVHELHSKNIQFENYNWTIHGGQTNAA